MWTGFLINNTLPEFCSLESWIYELIPRGSGIYKHCVHFHTAVFYQLFIQSVILCHIYFFHFYTLGKSRNNIQLFSSFLPQPTPPKRVMYVKLLDLFCPVLAHLNTLPNFFPMFSYLPTQLSKNRTSLMLPNDKLRDLFILRVFITITSDTSCE